MQSRENYLVSSVGTLHHGFDHASANVTQAALQEVTKLKQAIYLLDQHASEIHLQRKESAEELKHAEGFMQSYMRDALHDYVETEQYMDLAQEALEEKRADLVLDKDALVEELKKRVEWRNDTISMEPEFSRLMGQVEWLDKKCAYLERQHDSYEAEGSRINEILDCCEKIYEETIKKSAEEEVRVGIT